MTVGFPKQQHDLDLNCLGMSHLSLYFHIASQVTFPGCGSSSGELEVLMDPTTSRHYIRQLPSWTEVVDTCNHLISCASRCLGWQEESSPLSLEPLLHQSLKSSTFSQSGSGRRGERSVAQLGQLFHNNVDIFLQGERRQEHNI